MPDKAPRNRNISQLLLTCLSIGLFLTGSYLTLRQFVLRPKTEYVAPPTLVATIMQTPTAAPEASPTPTPAPTPYALTPKRIYFTDYEEVCTIEPVGKIDPETGAEVGPYDPGSMATIDSPIIAAWYKYGASPGQNGNAILAGHRSVDGQNGVFSLLHKIRLNDEIVIEMSDGSFLRYYVHNAEFFSVNEIPPWVMDLDMDSEESYLTLITCQGRFENRHSVNRAVARCYLYRLPIEEEP